jgi:hypothetical protein
MKQEMLTKSSLENPTEETSIRRLGRRKDGDIIWMLGKWSVRI